MLTFWNHRTLTLLSVFLFLGVTIDFISAQYFNPTMNDKTYLDVIQKEVSAEVKETKAELMDQARVIEGKTKNYIAAKLKQNLFKALRILAEKELKIDSMTMQERPRQPRQDEEGGDEDSDSPSTTRRPSMILPQVASLIKAVFGGNINLTAYVESSTKFLPKPIGTQLTGVVKLLANNPGSRYTTTTTTTSTTTTTTPKPTPSTARSKISRTSRTTTTTATSTTTARVVEEEDDEDEFRFLPTFIGRGLRNLLRNNNSVVDVISHNKTVLEVPEELPVSSVTSIMANKMQVIDVKTLALEVQKGLADVVKEVPDIFMGAREAYSLLNTVSNLFSRLDFYN